MSENGNQSREWSSRFGYIMVAAGAAIGLGNIWKFPYLAYQGGGGVFLVVYILIVAVMAHPMVEMETAIGRHSASDTVTCFERINKKWGFVGWLANICTLLINMYYVVVGGWVLKYAFQYIISGVSSGIHNRQFRQTGLLHRFYYFNCRTDYLGYDLTGIRLYIVTVRNHQSCRKSNQDYHADTLSLPYYMWYLGDLCNR